MQQFLFVISILFLSQNVFAQFQRYTSLYNYDLKQLNPAFAGLLNKQEYHLQYSGSRIGHDNSPYTALTGFSLHAKKINSGFGGFVWNQEIGSYKEVNASFLYNYQLKTGEKSCLSLGTELRYVHTSVDYSDLKLNVDDPLLDATKDDQVIADFGVVYKTGNLFVGASTVNLVQSHQVTIEGARSSRKYNFYVGYELPVTPWMSFRPSVYIMNDGAGSTTADLNGIVLFKKVLFAGATVQLGGFKNFAKYNAGVVIAKRVQLIAIVYSGVAHYYDIKPTFLELMVKVVIGNRANK